MNNNYEQLMQRLINLEQKVNQGAQTGLLVGQQNIIPGSIKNRAMGEANSYVFGGSASNKPTVGVVMNTNSFSIYFDTTANKLWIWNGSVWKSVSLT